MYTNPSNIIKSYIGLLEDNRESIDTVLHVYQPSKRLLILEGIRKTLPSHSFPVLEFEPTSGSNQWGTTRSQRPRYSFECLLSVINSNEDYGVEYITTLTTTIVEILTDPQNLQLPVTNEVKWEPGGGLVQTYIMDSLVESVTYNSAKEGTVRSATFDLFTMIHEPFPDDHWAAQALPEDSAATVLRPRSQIIPELS